MGCKAPPQGEGEKGKHRPGIIAQESQVRESLGRHRTHRAWWAKTRPYVWKPSHLGHAS